MTNRDVWLAAFASALGTLGCGDALPSTPTVGAREVTGWDAARAPDVLPEDAALADAAPVVTSPPPAPSASHDDVPAAPPPAGPRLDAFVTRVIARPTPIGARPRPPDPCARGRNNLACIAQANCGPVDPSIALRAAVQLDAKVGLAPRPGLDAATTASAAATVAAIERQSRACAEGNLFDSALVTIELAAGADGVVHATVSGATAMPTFPACITPLLERRGFVGAGAQPLRFYVAIRATWK